MSHRDLAAVLVESGFTLAADHVDSAEHAWAVVREVAEVAHRLDPLPTGLPPLGVVAEYTMPSAGAPVRDFQVLHLDFGLPLGLSPRADVAHYTGLFVDPAIPPSGARTRIVRLAEMATQRAWPGVEELVERLRSRPDDPDAAEGVLARVVEVATGRSQLPAKTEPGFLCGLEFDSPADELAFLAGHGLEPTVHEVVVPPGGVLVFDNLRCAHGRSGRRSTGELHQLCLGYRALGPKQQLVVLRHGLGQLTGAPTGRRPRPAGTP